MALKTEQINRMLDLYSSGVSMAEIARQVSCSDTAVSIYLKRQGVYVKKDFRNTHEDFLDRIVKNEVSGCWEWQGSKATGGYGTFTIDGKCWSAHRYAYNYYRGGIAEEMFVLHRCDNPPCCNPDHLFLGTHQDNMKDMVQKGRCDDIRKLTRKQVVEIRSLLKDGNMKQKEIAALYNVSHSSITQIKLKHTCKYV